MKVLEKSFQSVFIENEAKPRVACNVLKSLFCYDSVRLTQSRVDIFEKKHKL